MYLYTYENYIMFMTIEQQIENSVLKGPHVVLLGAGASVATIPNGDKFGHKISAMEGFIDKLGLSKVISNVNLKTTSENLEAIYSELDSREDCKEVKKQLEEAIYYYFSDIEIPNEPTIYDFLILSMRSKDYIFTFNWDDLLIQAYVRMMKITTDLPQINFLHGNVGIKYCKKCHTVQLKYNTKCINCGKSFDKESVPPLLFPVSNKDYTSNEYINKAWELFETQLRNASILTIFGYGAPSTDAAAVEIMTRAFKSKAEIRWYDRVEIIDIKNKSDIYDTWSKFINIVHNHGYIYDNFFDSIIAKYPRRSIEGYVKQYLESWWGKATVTLENNVNITSIRDLENVFQPLLENENKGHTDVVL